MKQITQFFEHYDVHPDRSDLRLLMQIASAYSHLPYENVTKIIKDARNLSASSKFRLPEEVLEDHLRWKTGGTCFSLCNTLLEILTCSGFDAFIAMADMHYGANIHCAVVVKLDECQQWLLDPGYLLHDPIPLPETEIKRKTQMNHVILKNEGNSEYSLFTQEQGIEKWRYRLRAQPTSRYEFERHWLHSFSLNSMEHLMLSRLSESGRIYYRKNRMELVQPDQRVKQKINTGDFTIVSDVFGLPADLIREANRLLGR